MPDNENAKIKQIEISSTVYDIVPANPSVTVVGADDIEVDDITVTSKYLHGDTSSVASSDHHHDISVKQTNNVDNQTASLKLGTAAAAASVTIIVPDGDTPFDANGYLHLKSVSLSAAVVPSGLAIGDPTAKDAQNPATKAVVTGLSADDSSTAGNNQVSAVGFVEGLDDTPVTVSVDASTDVVEYVDA